MWFEMITEIVFIGITKCCNSQSWIFLNLVTCKEQNTIWSSFMHTEQDFKNPWPQVAAFSKSYKHYFCDHFWSLTELVFIAFMFHILIYGHSKGRN